MSITNRTVYYDNTDGITRFWDYAKVTTTIGAMMEPFTPGCRHSPDVNFESFDPDDEINRIDDIRALPIDKHQLIFGEHVQGGVLQPRDGR